MIFQVAFRDSDTLDTHSRVSGVHPQQNSVVAPATAHADASLKPQLQKPVGPSAPELAHPKQACPQHDVWFRS
eukprot:12907366-Prorocentrum_lima.AAC.1